MQVLISGASGLVGSELKKLLLSEGHTVCTLIRNREPRMKSEIFWDPYAQKINLSQLEGFDAIVHLAGDNIAQGRWTEEKKRSIRESRLITTDFLSVSIAHLELPPAVFISASALGFYGNRPGEVLDEESSKGTGFLADLAADWETAAEPAKSKGVRVVNARIGVVISKFGGMLQKILTPFRLGLGGKLGSGKQIVSWIHLEDLTRAILFCINNERLSGPVNLVSPNPVSNAELTTLLASELKRPAIFGVPHFAAKLAFGEMADEMLFSSANLKPAKLLESGFTYKHNDLNSALEAELK